MVDDQQGDALDLGGGGEADDDLAVAVFAEPVVAPALLRRRLAFRVDDLQQPFVVLDMLWARRCTSVTIWRGSSPAASNVPRTPGFPVAASGSSAPHYTRSSTRAGVSPPIRRSEDTFANFARCSSRLARAQS